VFFLEPRLVSQALSVFRAAENLLDGEWRSHGLLVVDEEYKLRR
jgi:hypothetical protein